MKRIALLAHDYFPDRGEAKTAVGLLRYGPYDVRAVLDRRHAGAHVPDVLPRGPDVPIVAHMDAVEDEVDGLVIGVANVGGHLDDAWRPDVRAAPKRGCTVAAGLHDFLQEDPEFAALAETHDAAFWDVRRPPDDLPVGRGVAADVDATVVLTVGTDCAVGKKTVALELTRAARARGASAAFVPTGQTGVLIAGWGTVVDAVPSDFVAGAVEQMILEKGDEVDWLFVEGQGSIVHPGYSGVACGLLHGAMSGALVLCHAAGRRTIHGFESFQLPPLRDYVRLHEDLARPVRPTHVAAGALNTSNIAGEGDARQAVDEYAAALDRPAALENDRLPGLGADWLEARGQEVDHPLKTERRFVMNFFTFILGMIFRVRMAFTAPFFCVYTVNYMRRTFDLLLSSVRFLNNVLLTFPKVRSIHLSRGHI